MLPMGISSPVCFHWTSLGAMLNRPKSIMGRYSSKCLMPFWTGITRSLLKINKQKKEGPVAAGRLESDSRI